MLICQPVQKTHPVLLPTKHHFTELPIKDKHQLVQHNGIQETLSAIRENYWIVRGREAVKKVVRKCNVCQHYEEKPYTSPPAPPITFRIVSNEPSITQG